MMRPSFDFQGILRSNENEITVKEAVISTEIY